MRFLPICCCFITGDEGLANTNFGATNDGLDRFWQMPVSNSEQRMEGPTLLRGIVLPPEKKLVLVVCEHSVYFNIISARDLLD